MKPRVAIGSDVFCQEIQQDLNFGSQPRRTGEERTEGHRLRGPKRQYRHQSVARGGALGHVQRQNGDAESTQREIKMNDRVADHNPEQYIWDCNLRTSGQLPGSKAYAGVRYEFVKSARIAVCRNVFRAREESSLRSWIGPDPS